MKVGISFTDGEEVTHAVSDVGMLQGGVVLKLSSDIDLIVPFNNVHAIKIDKETPCVVMPGGRS